MIQFQTLLIIKNNLKIERLDSEFKAKIKDVNNLHFAQLIYIDRD